MSKTYKVSVENGYYIFKLEKLLETKGISKNKLVRDINTDFKVLQRIFNGDLIRIDINVLARICDYFDCKIEDIIEYVPRASGE